LAALAEPEELASEVMAALAVLAKVSSEVLAASVALHDLLAQETQEETHHIDHQTLEMLGTCNL
jgi:hypothetical protein